ncbi:hypothetical protein M3Y95_01224300 [Aphelenchoides besseyi]|nr:hypothetical protein M3Y95_01224300 [Aphelenchoides besseyi]
METKSTGKLISLLISIFESTSRMNSLLRQSNVMFRSVQRSALQLRLLSDQKQQPPSKETLLTTDWMLEGLMPNFFKSNLGVVFQRMALDVEFEDKIFGYKLRGSSDLNFHLMKVRAYFRYKSPYNKLEYLGSIVYEDHEVLTILWRLQSLKSSFMRYFPTFITGKQQEYRKWDGAMDFYVQSDGKIYKIINRPATDNDREAALKLSELKRLNAQEVERKESEIADKKPFN